MSNYHYEYVLTYVVTVRLHLGHNRLTLQQDSHKQKWRHGKAKTRISSVKHHVHLRLLEPVKKIIDEESLYSKFYLAESMLLDHDHLTVEHIDIEKADVVVWNNN